MISVLDTWKDVANITFNRVGWGDQGPDAYSDKATILFGNYKSGDDGAGAFTVRPRLQNPHRFGEKAPDGDVWINLYKQLHISFSADEEADLSQI